MATRKLQWVRLRTAGATLGSAGAAPALATAAQMPQLARRRGRGRQRNG